MPQPFSTQLDLKLIRLVKENSVLYNPRHPKYSDSDTRELTWQKLSDVLGKPTQRCKSRWLNIRDMMRRTLRMRLQYPEEYNRKYRFEDELQFMVPYFKIRKTTEDLKDYLDESAEAVVEMPPEFEDNLKFDEHSLSTQPIMTFRNRVEEASNANRSETESVFQELNPTDPLDVFLMAIGSSLKKFNPYYLNQAKSKIFQICQDYELQQITDKPGQGPSLDRNG